MACISPQRDAIEVLYDRTHHHFPCVTVLGKGFSLRERSGAHVPIYLLGVSPPRSVDGRHVAVFSLRAPEAGWKPPRNLPWFDAAVLVTAHDGKDTIELLSLEIATEHAACFGREGVTASYTPTIGACNLAAL